MCLHKEGFDAVVQRRVENVTNKYELIHPDLLNNFSELMQRSSSKALERATNVKEYKELVTAVLSTTGTRSEMVLNYLRDVSTMLAIAFALRTRNSTQNSQAERQIIKFIFAFDQIRHARYNSFEHVLLSNLSKDNPKAFDDLLKDRFGATSLGETFSAVYRDLVTEYFNKESKGMAGSYRSGYTTHHNTVNKWIATSRIHSRLRVYGCSNVAKLFDM